MSAVLVVAMAGAMALGGPVGEEVVHGSAGFAREGSLTTITAADKTIVHYQSFDIAAAETVRFVQPGETATVLNRILGASPTQIDGTLRANGIVYFVNPAGVRFGASAVVDVGQIVAAAGKMSDADFLAGVNRFTDLAGEVVNYGSITGGSVTLAGRAVANYGSIVAERGMVAMVAGDEVMLTQLGSQMMVTVSGGGGEKPGVENAGEVVAHSSAYLGAGDMFSLAVKNVGTVRAKDIAIQGKKVEIGGTVEASGQAAVQAEDVTVALTAGDDAMTVAGDATAIALDINGRAMTAMGVQRLQIDAGDGDDTVTVDASLGIPIPADGLFYNGQDNTTPTGDSLVLTGSTPVAMSYLFTGPTSGAITLDGSTLTYTGLEPVVDLVPGDLTINGTGAANTIAITDGPGTGGGTTSLVQIDAFESIEFANKTTVTINGLDGADQFTVNNPNPADGQIALEIYGNARPGGMMNPDDSAADQFACTAIGGGIALLIDGQGGADLATVVSAGAVGTPLTSATVNVETLDLQGPIYAAALAGSAAAVNVQNDTASIQDGLDVAAPGATVTVADGTYAESLVVETSGVTLASVNGRGSTTIDLQGDVGGEQTSFLVMGTAGGFTLGGAASNGFAVVGHATLTNRLLQLNNNPADVTISYNSFNSTGSGQHGISVGAAGASGLTIDNNTFTAGEAGDLSIWGPSMVDLTVTNNTFTGPATHAASGWAAQFAGVTVSALAASTIADNTIDDYGGGIGVFNGPGTSELTITRNAVTGCTTGIRLGQYSPGVNGDMTTVTVTNNLLTNNTTGLKINSGANVLAANFAINANSFNTSGTFALDNDNAGVPDASANWWGSNTPAGVLALIDGTVDYTPWLDTNVDSDVGTNGFQPTYDTLHVDADSPQVSAGGRINEALGLIDANGTVSVEDGTYAESLVVDASGVTLASVSGRASTTIDLQGDVGGEQTSFLVMGTAGGFTLGGGASNGFAVVGHATLTKRLLQLNNSPADVTISYNSFNSTGSATHGISVGAAGASGLTIDNNTFTAGEAGDLSIWGPSMVDLTVTNNTFTGPAALAASGWAMQFAGVTVSALAASTIADNTIDDYGGGIGVFNGPGTSELTITRNAVTGCTAGIRLGQYSPGVNGDMTTVTVTNNTLGGAGASVNTTGLLVNDGANVQANQFVITANDFVGNTTGLDNQHATQVVNAEDNWWGSANGPEHDSNVFNKGSQGDPVSDNVDFVTWLDASYTVPGTPFGPIYNTTQDTYHASFQDAIDNAVGGDGIEATDGVYTEDFVLDKASLNIHSANGAAATTIQTIDGVGIQVESGGDVLTFGDAGAGFTVLSGAGTTSLMRVDGDATQVEMYGNVFDTTGNASTGVEIAAGAQDADVLRIEGNSFIAEEGDGSITAATLSNPYIVYNQFTGPNAGGGAFPATGHAIETNGTWDVSAIEGNTIDGYATGIRVRSGTGVRVDIATNTIENCGVGVHFVQDPPDPGNGDVTDAGVYYNLFDSNDIGVQIDNGPNVLGSNIWIGANSFTNHATWAIESTNDEIVDCPLNWWGTNDPAQVRAQFTSTANGGNGIDYTPWLGTNASVVGYAVTDNNDLGGPAYDFEDISGTGTPLALGDDDNSGLLPLGFDLAFFGTDYPNIVVSSNGYLVFDLDDPNDFSPDSIPDTRTPNGLIAGWWNDLDPNEGPATVHYEVLGAPGSHRFIVQYTDVEHWLGGDPSTFQLKLFEGTNVIEAHYQLAQNDGSPVTVGIEAQFGMRGHQYFYGSADLPASTAVRYTPGASGFYPDLSSLHVDDASPQIGATGRIQEGHDNLLPDGILHVHEGTYNTGLATTKPFTMNLPDGAVTLNTAVVLGDHLTVTGNQDLTVNDTILGAADGVADLLMNLGAGNVIFTDAVGAPGARLDDFACGTTGNIAFSVSAGNLADTVTVHTAGDTTLGSDVATPRDRATIWAECTLDVSAGGNITVGNHHVVSVPYSAGVSTLNLTTPGTLTVSDLNAGTLNLVADTVRVWAREGGTILRADGSFERDFGTQIIGLDAFNATVNTWQVLGGGIAPTLAMRDSAPAVTPAGFNIGILRVRSGAGDAELVGAAPAGVVLDLIADPANLDVGTIFASVIPRLEEIEVIPDEVELSAALRELLEQLGIFARDPGGGERSRGVFDDLIAKPPSEWRPDDHQVATTRLDPELTRRAVDLYRAAFWRGDQYLAGQLRGILEKALALYREKHKGEKLDPAAFRRFLETEPAATEARDLIHRLARLFRILDQLGLNAREQRISESIIVRDIIPRGLSSRDLVGTIEAGGPPAEE